MISKNDKRIIKFLIILAVSVVALYTFQDFYFSRVGKLVTEYALNYTQKHTVSVEGFAVRDENRNENGSNSAILYKSGNKYYVPLVDDSANVSKNNSIAIAFSEESGAKAYLERLDLKKKIEDLQKIKSQGTSGYANVSGMNTLIYSSALSYAQNIGDGNLKKAKQSSDDLVQRITTKQLATGEKMNFNNSINEYKSQYESLKGSLGNYERIKAPFAGYFVSTVDGYESSVSYFDVKNKKLKSGAGKSFIELKANETADAYGKLIGQFTWYFVFDIHENEISLINEGSTVYVNFPDKDIENIKMTVHDITKEEKNSVTVTLKCKMMNEQLVSLRKENAVILIEEISGLKISRSAVVKNEEGLDGVYVLSGNVVRFSPIDIKYYGDDYVIADKYYIYKKDENGDRVIDYENTDKYRSIKVYDNVIVKGNNLEDGKIINR